MTTASETTAPERLSPDKAAPAGQTSAWPTSLHLNSLRGLACLLLVGFHASEAVIGKASAGVPFLMIFHEIMEPIRMPLFSFLSGFVYALRPVAAGHALEFERKKVRRLLIPFLSLTVILFAMKMLTDPQGAQTFLHYLLHPFSHLWFLQALFFVFIVYAVVDGNFPATHRANAAWVFAASLPLFLSPVRNVSALSFGDAAYILPFFALGVLACRNSAWLAANARAVTAVLTGAAALLVAYAVHLVLGAGDITRHDPIILLMSLTCILLLLMIFPSVGGLARIGVYSFSIYLFHTIFTEIAARVSPDSGLIALPAAFVAALAGPIAVELVIARYLPVFSFVIGKRWS